jgi:hypothetical protein
MPLAFASFGYAIVTTYAGGEALGAHAWHPRDDHYLLSSQSCSSRF